MKVEREQVDGAPEGGSASRWGSVLIGATFLIGIGSVFLVSPENAEVRAALQALGPLAPLAYFLTEIVQVVIIPVPGQPFEVAGGWLLGLAGGSVIGSAGAFAGSLAAFHIARRFGRDWVRRHVGGGVQSRVARELEKGSRME
ncbi:MAG: TVP38/TMEM64 family protein, partial [Gemmatimonadota bacterium]